MVTMVDNEKPAAVYLEKCIFPILLPGMEDLLKVATETEVFLNINPKQT